MSEILIRFTEGFPHALREEVEGLLRPFLFIIPEIHEVTLQFETEDGEAGILPLRHYHVAHLALDPVFFSLTFSEKERTLLHEIFHIKADILAREAATIVEMWVPEPVQAYARKHLEDREEELVDDLARVMMEVLTPAVGRPRFEEYHLPESRE